MLLAKAIKMHLRTFLGCKKQIFFVQNFQRICKRALKTQQTNLQKKVTDDPVQYSTSEAGQWKAKYTTSGKEYFTTPKIQPFAIVFSLTCFMVWFCILREENDWDDWLRQNETKVPLRMEEYRLRTIIEDRKKTNMSTGEFEEKLKEVLKKKQAENSK